MALAEIDTVIQGIPCTIAVLSWTPYCPGNTWAAPENCYPDEGGEGEWGIWNRQGYRMEWLERRLTEDDRTYIEQLTFDHMETKQDYEPDDYDPY